MTNKGDFLCLADVDAALHAFRSPFTKSVSLDDANLRFNSIHQPRKARTTMVASTNGNALRALSLRRLDNIIAPRSAFRGGLRLRTQALCLIQDSICSQPSHTPEGLLDRPLRICSSMPSLAMRCFSALTFRS